MTTIKDIAERAGVSTATVSNVIHGNTKKVSPATIELIENLIKEMGYVQKMGLSVLNNSSSKMVAVVIHTHKKYEDAVISDPLLRLRSSALSKKSCVCWVIICCFTPQMMSMKSSVLSWHGISMESLPCPSPATIAIRSGT